ncbi:hypothetical protein [Actinocrispum wychmicini]|uniref:hypothetical protein n=1 Tax=Actinocrispum wychmicini TaxID=1213861 RepID=UPI001FB5A017|nr:hypothetical protein [Actinocrispum wychmicini]
MTTHSRAISDPLHPPLRTPPPGTGMSDDVSFALNGSIALTTGRLEVVVAATDGVGLSPLVTTLCCGGAWTCSAPAAARC